ncbi:MAG TPA: YdcF family protein [Acidimicrobiales bacterium]|nr:YdcF family protein [Acidimicrobiales bacterium]
MLRAGLVVKLAAALVGALGIYLAVTFVQVWGAAERDQARPVQAIVVLGAAQYDGRPSPVLRARLDHAADLYGRGLAERVVVTGGKRQGDRVTEATVSADYLARHGVPEPAILREVHGRSSWQQLAAAAGFLRQRGITRVLLVSDGFHAARIAAIADELGLEGFTSPAPGSPISGAEKLPYLGRETVAVAAGRLLGFRRVAGIKTSASPPRSPPPLASTAVPGSG